MIHRIRVWLRTMLGFSRSETNGFLILIPLLFFILIAAPMYKRFRQVTDVSARDVKLLDSLISTLRWDSAATPKEVETLRLFTFDPNTASQQDLIQLGLSEIVANRIANYRSKGGQFRHKGDFGKIYGMDSSTFRRLIPYLKIAPAVTTTHKRVDSVRTTKRVVEKFDINKADTSQLKSVFGIGTVRAERIVKYRDKLGGFHSLRQLNEVYGLDSAVVSRLVARTFIDDAFKIKRIALNTATENELAAHPYLNAKNARAIAAYRFQHGKFQNLEELQKIATLTEEIIQKIKPYLSLD